MKEKILIAMMIVMAILGIFVESMFLLSASAVLTSAAILTGLKTKKQGDGIGSFWLFVFGVLFGYAIVILLCTISGQYECSYEAVSIICFALLALSGAGLVYSIKVMMKPYK